jgi:hypothetical protein
MLNKPGVYTGSKDDPSKAAWLISMERYLAAIRAVDADKVRVACTYLSPEVQSILFGEDASRVDTMSWDAFKTFFLDATVGGTLATDQHVYAQLDALRYGKGGVFNHAELLTAVEGLTKRFRNKVADSTKIFFALKIAHRSIIKDVQQTHEGKDWSTYEAFRANFLAQAAMFEASQQRNLQRHNQQQQQYKPRYQPYQQQQYRRPFQRPMQQQQQQQTPAPFAGATGTPQGRCFRCGKYGHYANQCRSPYNGNNSNQRSFNKRFSQPKAK